MDDKKKPDLIICQDIIDVIDHQLNEITLLNTYDKKDFLYAYTLLEGTIWRVLYKILFAFPNLLIKDANKNEKLFIEEDKLLKTNDYYVLLEDVVNEKLHGKSKTSMIKYLKYLIKILEYQVSYNDGIVLKMTEDRNKIAHNNSPMFNDLRFDPNSFCSIDRNTGIEYINEVKNILQSIKNAVCIKYRTYTHEKLLKDSWKYTMPSHVALTQIFMFNKNACINKIEAQNAALNLSSGERYMLLMWLMNYSCDVAFEVLDKKGYISNHAFVTFTEEIIYLNQMFKMFPYMINGRELNIK